MIQFRVASAGRTRGSLQKGWVMGVPAVPKCLGIDFRWRTRRLRHKEKARREDLNQIIGSEQNTTCPCRLLAVCWMLGCLHCHLFRENSTSTGFHLHGLHDAASVLHERERITSKTQRRCIQLHSPRDGGQLHAMTFFEKRWQVHADHIDLHVLRACVSDSHDSCTSE